MPQVRKALRRPWARRGILVVAALAVVVIAIGTAIDSIVIVSSGAILGSLVMVVTLKALLEVETAERSREGRLATLTDRLAAVDRATSREVATLSDRLAAVDRATSREVAAVDREIAVLADKLSAIGRSNDQLQGHVAELRSSQVDVGASVGELARRLDEVVYHQLPASEHGLESRLVQERRARIMSVVRLRSETWHAHNVVLLLTPQRVASTWAFDVLRTHPNVELDPSIRTWSSLGLDGRRYPKALSDLPGASIELEVEPRTGVMIPDCPTFDSPAGEVTWALEKAHPEFFDFAPERLVEAVGDIERSGTTVLVVIIVRDPLQSMWSMAEYQQRDPGWYRWLEPARIPEFVLRSYETLDAIDRALPTRLLQYDTFRFVEGEMPALAEELGVRSGRAWFEQAAAWAADNAERNATSRFVGVRDSERSETGPSGVWSDHAAEISAAQLLWRGMTERHLETAGTRL